jgi:hypothetical protein
MIGSFSVNSLGAPIILRFLSYEPAVKVYLYQFQSAVVLDLEGRTYSLLAGQHEFYLKKVDNHYI